MSAGGLVNIHTGRDRRERPDKVSLNPCDSSQAVKACNARENLWPYKSLLASYAERKNGAAMALSKYLELATASLFRYQMRCLPSALPVLIRGNQNSVNRFFTRIRPL